jgi:hypothetical protein
MSKNKKEKERMRKVLTMLKIKKPRLKVKPPKVEVSKKTYNRKKKSRDNEK